MSRGRSTRLPQEQPRQLPAGHHEPSPAVRLRSARRSAMCLVWRPLSCSICSRQPHRWPHEVAVKADVPRSCVTIEHFSASKPKDPAVPQPCGRRAYLQTQALHGPLLDLRLEHGVLVAWICINASLPLPVRGRSSLSQFSERNSLRLCRHVEKGPRPRRGTRLEANYRHPANEWRR